MKKLLFLSSELPFPAQSGGKLKSLQTLKFLSKNYQVSVACPLKCEDDQHVDDFLGSVDVDLFMTASVNRSRSLKNLLTSYYRQIPLNVLRTESLELKCIVAEVAHDFDAIFIDHYEAAQYVPDDYQGTILYHAHNAYHQIWLRYARSGEGILHRAAAAFEYLRVRRAEKRLCNASDLVFAAPNDIRTLRGIGVRETPFKETYHLGDPDLLNKPDLQLSADVTDLVYVGYLGWEPNVCGLLWFIDEVWPQLCAKHPNLQLKIVGKNADDRLVAAVNRSRNIVLTGFVQDLESVYQSSRIAVAPLFFGSGMKVKVLSSLARGIPTVTTSVGVEGIDAKCGDHVLIADEADSMIAQIESLLESPALWSRLASRSRQLIRERYTWGSMFEVMRLQINLVMSGGMAAQQTAPEVAGAALAEASLGRRAA